MQHARLLRMCRMFLNIVILLMLRHRHEILKCCFRRDMVKIALPLQGNAAQVAAQIKSLHFKTALSCNTNAKLTKKRGAWCSS